MPFSAQVDPRGHGLRDLLRAQSRAEVWEPCQRLFARVVVGVSLPMAYWLRRGQGIQTSGPRFVFVLWFLAFACTIGCAAADFGARHQEPVAGESKSKVPTKSELSEPFRARPLPSRSSKIATGLAVSEGIKGWDSGRDGGQSDKGMVEVDRCEFLTPLLRRIVQSAWRSFVTL